MHLESMAYPVIMLDPSIQQLIRGVIIIHPGNDYGDDEDRVFTFLWDESEVPHVLSYPVQIMCST